MSNFPTDIANQALDNCGVEFTLGDIEEGTREAQVLLRWYGECRKQLLRMAYWDFARTTAPLLLLGDATGQTPDVGNKVIAPWVYEYALPQNCVMVRFVPWNSCANDSAPPGNIELPPGVPQTTGTTQGANVGRRLIPSRFLVANDYNYPPEEGQQIGLIQGVSPTGRTVILSNVKQAWAVYTADMTYPSVWDPLFRDAMVAYLGAQTVLALSKDKKMGLAMRREQIAIAKDKIMQARVRDGNETWSDSTTTVDWLRARNTGGGWTGWNNGGGSFGNDLGVYSYGWDVGFFNESAY